MNKENIPVITDIKQLYDECKNMEQLFYKYYLPLLDKHYSKTYELQQENRELKKQLEELKQTNKVLSEELTKDKILKQDCLTTCCGMPIGDIPKLINQQKEFIEYLENEIKNIQIKWENKLTENGYIDIAMTVRAYQIILQKYKEIIGV